MDSSRPARESFFLLRRCIRYCLAAAVLFLLAAGSVALFGLVEDVEPADAVVVMGSRAQPAGTPLRRMNMNLVVQPESLLTPRLKARLDRAAALFREGRCKIVVASGGVGRESEDEALAMREYLVRQGGVPAARVVAHSAGYDTRATAAFTAAYMKEHGLSRGIVVSQYFHILRCRIAFAQAGISEVGTAYARLAEWRDVFSIFRELPGCLGYWLGRT